MTKARRPTAQAMRKLADRQRVLEEVLAAGVVVRISKSELMLMLNRSNNCIKQHLNALELEGKVECSDTTGSRCRWGPPGTWAHHQGERDRNAALREAIHRIVPAADTPPIRQRAPCSVWEWAQRTG